MASNPTESQAILRQHSIFYEQTRLHPEIPPLRRFTAEGFHLLYCTAVEILDQEKECRKALLESGALPRGVTKFSVTDWQPTMMKDAKVKKEFTRYQDVLRRYCRCKHPRSILLLVQRLTSQRERSYTPSSSRVSPRSAENCYGDD